MARSPIARGASHSPSLLILLHALVLAACGGGDAPPPTALQRAVPTSPVPSISSLSPSSAIAGGAGFTLTVNGSDFDSLSVVRWNGGDRPTTFLSSTQLTASIPSSDIATDGAAEVTVFNPPAVFGGGSSNALAFTIARALTITTTAVPEGVAGRGYSHLLIASGGTPPYTWSAIGLPGLMSLNASTGELTGSPDSAGTLNLTVEVQDAGPPLQMVTQGFPLVVQEPLNIVNTLLLNGLRGSAYKQTLAATGGLPGYTWSSPAGTLPPGTTLMSAAGVLQGTPTAAGSFSFTLRLADTGNAATPACTAGVDCPEVNFTVVINEPFVYTTGIDGTSVIDAASNTVVTTIPGFTQVGVAVTPDGRQAYVTDFSQTVSVIDTATSTVVDIIPIPFPANSMGVAITPDGRFAYVTNAASNNVWVIDTASNTLVTSIPAFFAPAGVAITPDGRFAYVAHSTVPGALSVIDTGNNTVVTTITTADGLGTGSLGVAVTPDGRFAYIANASSDTVSVIDTASNVLVATVTTADGLGTGPTSVAITPDGRFAYVANNASETVSVIDATSNTVVATITVGPGIGQGAGGVAITPDGRIAYVASLKTDSVSVIDTDSNTVVDTIVVSDNPCCEMGVAAMPDPILRITTSTLPSGSVGVNYSFSVVAAGGVPPHTFGADPASLPPGLSIDANGFVSGTPTAVGTFSLDVTVTDSAMPAESVTKTVTLGVL